MPGRHTAESIRDVYDMCLSKWNINDKVCRIVSDNASNMVKAFNIPGFSVEYEILFENARESSIPTDTFVVEAHEENSAELEMTCENVVDSEDEQEQATNSDLESVVESAFFTSALHLKCPIHTLQLAINDAFSECEDIAALTTKVSKLVSSIRHSTLNTAFTDSLGVRPTVSCVTRWNSQLKMIQSVLKLLDKDADFQNKLNISDTSKLAATELRSLTCIVQALQPLAEVTETWQAEYGTLGVILPSVMEVKSLMSAVRGPISIKIFADTLAKNVEERFKKYYDDVNVVIAAVLDPRFKIEWILRDENVRDRVSAIRELVIHNAQTAAAAATATSRSDDNVTGNVRDGGSSVLAETVEGHAEAGISNTKKPKLLFASYSQHLDSSSVMHRTAADELNDYLSLPRLQPSADVLSFWKSHKEQYPQLAELARATFGIPSGSASAERVFSAGGLITRVHRLSMKPATLEKLVFLKVNSALLF